MSLFGTYLQESISDYNLESLYETIDYECNDINYLFESIEVDLKYINETNVNIKEIFKNIFEKIKTIIDKIIKGIDRTVNIAKNITNNRKNKDEKDDNKEKENKTYQDFDIIINFNDNKSEKFNGSFLKNAQEIGNNGVTLANQAYEGFRKNISYSTHSNTYVDKETVDKINDWVESQRYPVSINKEQIEGAISYYDFLNKWKKIKTECDGALSGLKTSLNIIKRNASVFNLSSDNFSNPYERYRNDLSRIAQQKCSEILKILKIVNYYSETISRIYTIALNALYDM